MVIENSPQCSADSIGTFHYRAARPNGSVVRGELQAANAASARAALDETGLYVLALEPRPPGSAQQATRRDLAAVFRSVALLANAGVSVGRALAASETVTRGALRGALRAARERVGEGVALSTALDAQGVVPGTVIGIIAAGERGSRLPEALEEVATQLEKEAEMVSRVRSALAYPLLILVVGLVSIAVLGAVIVPRFAVLIGEFGNDLPLTTRVLLDASALLLRFWWLAAATFAAVGWALAASRRSTAGRLRIDGFLLRLPVVGAIRHSLATARVARALGGMLTTGMPLLQALGGAERAVGDAAMARRLADARARVARGEQLSRSLGLEGALTAPAVQLIAVGEASGELAVMAGRAGDLAFGDAERGLRMAVAMLEPALVIILGGLVAFVSAALLQAVYSVRPGF